MSTEQLNSLPYPNAASEEALSDLIFTLFDWLEQELPGIFDFRGSSMRLAMERYFYFASVNTPVHIRPLLLATEEWRERQKQNPLATVYDVWLGMSKRHSLMQSLRTKIKCAIRYLNVSRTNEVQPESSTVVSKKIGFFAINRRFVGFFKEYAEACSQDRVTFFCPEGTTAQSAIEYGFDVVFPRTRGVSRDDLVISWWHPLFEAYWVSAQIYAAFYQMVSANRPAVMVFGEGTSMEDAVMAMATKAYDVPTIRLQSGRAGVLHVGYRNMPFDRMLCWGEGFVERYKRFTPQAEYVVTGSLLTDDVSDMKTIDRHHPTCCIFTQPISKHIAREDYEELVATGKKLLNCYPKMHLLIRKHPVDQSTLMDDIVREYPDRVTMADTHTYTLKAVMQVADIGLGFYSTTLSESAACGVIPVIFKLKESHSVFPYPEECGAAIEVSSADSAIEAIGRLLGDSALERSMRSNMRNFSQKYFGPADGRAKQRTIENILSVANHV